MKFLQKNWLRPLLERLEERAVPTFTSTSLVASATGNFTATIVTDQPTLNITYTATNDLQINDGGAPLVISGVTGNVSLTLSTTNAAAFSTNITSVGVLPGNFTATVNRAAAVATNVTTLLGGGAAFLGNLSLTTNTAGTSTVAVNGTGSIVGNLTINTNGGAATATKVADINGVLSIGGNVAVRNVHQATVQAGSTISGGFSATTRATSSIANAVSFNSGSSAGSISVVAGNVSGTGSSTVTLAGTVNTITTVALGTNTGAASTNVVNLASTFVSNGSLISITGKNGSKDINISGITASLARLTVSLGNGNNTVDFTGTNALLYTTLVGGTGTNTVTGTIPSPFRLIRFSF